MKKQIKRIGALVLAGVLALGMSVSALADDNNTFNGGTTIGQAQTNANRSGESLGTNNTLIFEKGIQLVDADDAFYIPNIPNLIFTYTVSAPAVATGTLASDGLSVMEVKKGVGTVSVSAVDTENQITNGVKFINNGSTNTISNVGTSTVPVYVATENLKLDFTSALAAVTEPGIYRYLVTETATLSGNDANKGYDYSSDVTVTSGDTRYVDMYVKWNDAATPVLEIYGYTMFTGTPTYSPTTVPNNVTASSKTDGFTYDKSTTAVTLNAEKTAEEQRAYTIANDTSGMTTYTTYDLVLRKTVSGAMAEKNREFDIDVLISKLPEDDGVYYVDKDGTTYTTASAAIAGLKLTEAQTAVGGGATTAGTVAANTITIAGMPTLKHDEYLVIKGLPTGTGTETATKYDVMENASATTTYGYEMSYIKDNISQADPTDSYTNLVANHGNIASGAAALTATFAMTKTAGTNAFYVDNDLDAISPTGVALRFAPYVVILAAGLALLFVSRRRRADDEE